MIIFLVILLLIATLVFIGVISIQIETTNFYKSYIAISDVEHILRLYDGKIIIKQDDVTNLWKQTNVVIIPDPYLVEHTDEFQIYVDLKIKTVVEHIHKIKFRNGDKLFFRIDNLIMVAYFI
jgi:hypothetical protein